jgi:hypothetical protein
MTSLIQDLCIGTISAFLGSYLFLLFANWRDARRKEAAADAPLRNIASPAIERVARSSDASHASHANLRLLGFHMLGASLAIIWTFLYSIWVAAAADTLERTHGRSEFGGFVWIFFACLALLVTSSVKAQRDGWSWYFWKRFSSISVPLWMGLAVARSALNGFNSIIPIAICVLLSELVAIGFAMPDPPQWIFWRKRRVIVDTQ